MQKGLSTVEWEENQKHGVTFVKEKKESGNCAWKIVCDEYFANLKYSTYFLYLFLG